MSVLSEQRLRELLQNSNVEERLIVMPLIDLDENMTDGSIDIRLGTNFIVTRSARVGGLSPFDREERLNAYQERVYVPALPPRSFHSL